MVTLLIKLKLYWAYLEAAKRVSMKILSRTFKVKKQESRY
jgi:hypothetical protein